MVLSAPKVMREFKFSVLLPVSRFFPSAGDDRVLMQGVVDCCIERDGKLTVIDFKTDRVSEAMLAERSEKYRPQLEAYSAALERIFEKKVREKILYFFAAKKAIKL